MNNTLFQLLQNRLPKIIDIKLDDYLFTKYPRVPYSNEYVSKSFKRIVRKLGLNEKVFLIGMIEGADKIKFLRNADVFALA